MITSDLVRLDSMVYLAIVGYQQSPPDEEIQFYNWNRSEYRSQYPRCL